MYKSGEDTGKATQFLGNEGLVNTDNHSEANLPSTSASKRHMSSPTNRPAALNTTVNGKDNLAMIVEAVSHAKEGILKDLARLLDDKLAGLDEVVVELIRSKSENDALKQKLKLAMDEKDQLRGELSKFKQVQFGFYRKVH